MLSTGILCQPVLHSVERKTPLADPVRKASRCFAHIRTIAEITFETVVPERHIGQVAVAVRHIDGHDPGPDIAQLHRCAGAVGHRIEDHGFAVGRKAPNLLFNTVHRIRF